MTPEESAHDEHLLADLSARLLEAQRRLRTLEASADDKAAVARRLIAVTNAAKHDAARAARRLDALLSDLDAGRYAGDGDSAEPL